MAKQKEEKLDYGALVRELKSSGPERLYLLRGMETYLRDAFLTELKRVCIPAGEDDFSYHRLNGPSVDMRELSDAVNSLPFMSERTLTEVRGLDLNRCREADAQLLERIIADIPQSATVCFVQDGSWEPDSRLKAVKAVRKHGRDVNFTSQAQGSLVTWIRKRFAALDKEIDPSVAMKLIFASGEYMAGLIPEIEKLASASKGQRITAEDVERFAHHLPEARIFDMTDAMAERRWDAAASILSELLRMTDQEPIATLAVIGNQFRRLYAARLAIDEGLGGAYVEKLYNIRFSGITQKLMSTARGFTKEQLRRAVSLCAETDYAMKSSGVDDVELLKELLVRIAGECP